MQLFLISNFKIIPLFKKQVDILFDPNSANLTFRCPYCSFGAKSRSQWLDHKMTEHGNMAHFSCEKCKVKCLTKEEMENHVTREHIKDNNSGLDEKEDKKKAADAQGVTMINDANPQIFSCSRFVSFESKIENTTRVVGL